MEAAFEDDSERKRWYNNHNLNDKDDKEELALRKVPTIYCESKYTTTLALHIHRAFSSNPPKKYLTKGVNQRFVPAPGVMVCYEMTRSFQAFLSDTARIQSVQGSMVSLPGIKLDTFFTPLSEDSSSPFHFSPHSLALEMPRDGNNPESAFFQLGQTDKETEIKGLCIPALTKMAPIYAKKMAHFINAKLRTMCADAYLERILTPEAVLEVSQYEYNMKTHKITPIDMEMPDCDGDRLIGFENIEDPLKEQQYQIDTADIIEVGSQVSRQAIKKLKKKSKETEYDESSVKSDLTEQTKNRTPSKAKQQQTHIEMKSQIKEAMKELNKSHFTLDEIVASADNAVAVPLRNLLSKSKKNTLTRSMIPLINKTLMAFCDKNNIIIPSLNALNEENSVISDITNMTGLTLEMDKEKDETNNQKETIKDSNKDMNKVTSTKDSNTKEVIDNNYKKPPNHHNNKQEEKSTTEGNKEKGENTNKTQVLMEESQINKEEESDEGDSDAEEHSDQTDITGLTRNTTQPQPGDNRSVNTTMTGLTLDQKNQDISSISNIAIRTEALKLQHSEKDEDCMTQMSGFTLDNNLEDSSKEEQKICKGGVN
jgi:hypothetical protein